ncbi:MAG: thioredoxin [Nitrospirae bacterium]|nr:thioredoxin [Nitrospirota bacterium]MBF0535306.1 thioredoxin [Nitrospirota bacterium]MBF0617271.1 thioredoxin [Nitrospirota bacterium]
MVKSAFIRCKSCGVVNKIPSNRFNDKPNCGKCKSPLIIPEKPVDINSSNFDEEVLRWPGLVVLDFWAVWCGACRIVAPVLDELAVSARGFVKVAKIDVDKHPDLGKRFAIKATPTLILFRDGVKINQIEGALSKDQLDQWIASSVKK